MNRGVTRLRRSIAVFCGSSSGGDPTFRRAARAVGEALAADGHRLVYGGGSVGLMKAVADAVLAGGGDVVGIITEQLLDHEVAHTGLTELEVVSDMHGRKARMAELADGVIVLPGGFGTLDETFEILTWNQLGLIATPVVFLDVDDYYEPLFHFIGDSVAAGFMKDHHGALAQRTDDPAQAVRIAAGRAPGHVPKWVD